MSVTLFIPDPKGEYPPCIPDGRSEIAAVRCVRCGCLLAVGTACPASDPRERYTLRTVPVAVSVVPVPRPRPRHGLRQWLQNECGYLMRAVFLGLLLTAVAIGLTILICSNWTHEP